MFFIFVLQGLEAHKANILAASSICRTLRTSLGPKGMAKVSRISLKKNQKVQNRIDFFENYVPKSLFRYG
jgi:hypothetical protein